MGISELNAASARKPVMNQGRRSGMRRAAVAAPLRLIHKATSISIGASSATRVSLTIVATSPAFCEKEKPPPIACATSWIERSEEHTSELQSLMRTSYAVFCLKKKTKTKTEMIKEQFDTQS